MDNFIIVECIYEPRGEHGLEGYQLGEKYIAERKEKDINGNPYYRVYPNTNDSYYETCGPTVFKRYFK